MSKHLQRLISLNRLAKKGSAMVETLASKAFITPERHVQMQVQRLESTRDSLLIATETAYRTQLSWVVAAAILGLIVSALFVGLFHLARNSRFYRSSPGSASRVSSIA